MTDFTPLASLAGGALIGLAASSLLLTNGRIAGISGILGGLVDGDPQARLQRVAFIVGLVLGGVALALATPEVFGTRGDGVSLALLGVAGVLVGYGTRLGGGCTSGHGVCGIARFSRRSIAATMTFMATGAITVFVVRHVVAS